MCSMDAHAVVFSNTLCVGCILYACRFCSVLETKLGTLSSTSNHLVSVCIHFPRNIQYSHNVWDCRCTHSILLNLKRSNKQTPRQSSQSHFFDQIHKGRSSGLQHSPLFAVGSLMRACKSMAVLSKPRLLLGSTCNPLAWPLVSQSCTACWARNYKCTASSLCKIAVARSQT